jgi:dTDP-4-amino-4,6-dideoxygalactose transaminase
VASFAPWPCFTDEEVNAVALVLRSNRVNYWTGEECRLFEREFAEWIGTSRAVALANGTVALDVALLALGIGPGDEVVVTPRTFIASASCVVNAGATPVFADVDRDSGNISAETIAPVLTDRTKAIIPVHLAGWPADMDPILALARERSLKVIEDCAQAHGARYKGRSVGSIGDIGAWSFCQDKIMTTGGEGGMVTLEDEELWSRMWSYKDHGKSFEAVYEREHPPGFRWVHESFGTNWRMIEMEAAIGRIQLRRMDDWTARRNANADLIRRALEPIAASDGPVRVPRFPSPEAASGEGETVHAQYKFYCYVRPENLAPGWDRDRVVAKINAAGVPCFQGSCSEVYLEKAFEGTGFAPPRRLPVARELGETSLMFLVHPTLTPEQMEKTAATAQRVLREAAGLA